MYTSADVDAAIKIAECEESKIFEDRKQYIKFYEIVERYVNEHGLYIDGNIGIKLLLYQPLTLQDYEYIIISKNPKDDAYAIANLIHKESPDGVGKYTYILPESQTKFAIYINQRKLFIVKSFGIVKEVEIFDILRPITRPAYYAKEKITLSDKSTKEDIGMVNLNIYSTDLQLINIYNKLTNVTLVSDYIDLMKYESLISKQFIKCHTSDDDNKNNKKGGASPPKQICNISTKQIIEEILSKFIPRHGHVLIGNYGILATKHNISIDKLKYSEKYRLQIISSNPFAEEMQFIIELVKRLSCRTFGIINDPNIPTDNQLRKLTFYVDRKNGQREVLLDIFNAAGYQLIPHNNHIGTVFTIMKYILVDFWTLQLLYKMEYNKAHVTLIQLSILIKQYKQTQQIYMDLIAQNKYDQIFPNEPSSYIGFYIDDIVRSKRLQSNVKTGIRTKYFPCSITK
jgi:hypothetical protein